MSIKMFKSWKRLKWLEKIEKSENSQVFSIDSSNDTYPIIPMAQYTPIVVGKSKNNSKL